MTSWDHNSTAVNSPAKPRNAYIPAQFFGTYLAMGGHNRGTDYVPGECIECSHPLSDSEVKRGSLFCSFCSH